MNLPCLAIFGAECVDLEWGTLTLQHKLQLPSPPKKEQEHTLYIFILRNKLMGFTCSRCPHLAATCGDWNEEE